MEIRAANYINWFAIHERALHKQTKIIYIVKTQS